MARPVATHLPLALQSPPEPPDTEDEEMDITAEVLCASADRWRRTLRELELPTLLWVALLSLMLLTFVGEITWSVTSLMWAIVMWKQGCRTLNLCATVGASAMGLALLGSILIVSGPSPAGKSATPYLELGCCAHGAGDGSFALRGVADACMPGGAELAVRPPTGDAWRPMPWHGSDGGDARLKVLVPLLLRSNVSNWVLIASHLPGRTARECRDRWAGVPPSSSEPEP